MSAIRPDFQPPVLPQGAGSSRARQAQSDFFRAATGQAAAATPVRAAPTPPAARPPAPVQPAPTLTAAAEPSRPLRPGSLLDIRI